MVIPDASSALRDGARGRLPDPLAEAAALTDSLADSVAALSVQTSAEGGPAKVPAVSEMGDFRPALVELQAAAGSSAVGDEAGGGGGGGACDWIHAFADSW